MLTLDLCQVKDVSPEGKNNLQKKRKKLFPNLHDCFVLYPKKQTQTRTTASAIIIKIQNKNF